MRVVDTLAWIEWLAGTPAGSEVWPLLPEQREWVVPTVVQLELATWLTREVSEEAAEQTIAFSAKCLVISLDTRIALAAADIGRRHKLAMADAIIYATAVATGADILTCDAHFEDLPSVVFLAKPSP